jgi:hypothetical protein
MDDLTFEQFRADPPRCLTISRDGVAIEMHHVSRNPEKVIPLCTKCHRGVELGSLRPDLKPEMSRGAFVKLKRQQNQKKRKEKEERNRKVRNRIWYNRLYRGF